MKKFLTLLIAFTSIFFINSCQEDGEWENVNGGQFGFTIERDNNFIEKGVGEVNQLKFNIKPNYDFSSIKTSFKFTTNLNGVLKLNGQTLTANKEYNFSNVDNIFEYTGNVSGSHQLSIIVSNDKGVSKEEKFSLEYGVSEFTHTYTGGTADIYQSDETPYLMKLVPNPGQPTTGFAIRFNSYDGNIKLNGVNAQKGQFYPLPNIDNFNVSLSTNKVGQGALDYTIKNATVSKNYNIQQTVIARKIVVESMNISATNVTPNTQMSLIGIVKKTPITANTSVKYKTWISAASNNNTNGIQSTNNVYTSYALGSNGSFSINFNAVATGTYTYNIQFQDEFGNESDVKSFNINVEPQIQFVGGAGGELGITASVYQWNHDLILKEFKRTLKVQTGGNTTISSIKYTIKVNFKLSNGNIQEYVREITENVSNGSNTYEIQNQNISISQSTMGNFSNQAGAYQIDSISIQMDATNSNNQTATKTVTGTWVSV